MNTTMMQIKTLPKGMLGRLKKAELAWLLQTGEVNFEAIKNMKDIHNLSKEEKKILNTEYKKYTEAVGNNKKWALDKFYFLYFSQIKTDFGRGYYVWEYNQTPVNPRTGYGINEFTKKEIEQTEEEIKGKLEELAQRREQGLEVCKVDMKIRMSIENKKGEICAVREYCAKYKASRA